MSIPSIIWWQHEQCTTSIVQCSQSVNDTWLWGVINCGYVVCCSMHDNETTSHRIRPKRMLQPVVRKEEEFDVCRRLERALQGGNIRLSAYYCGEVCYWKVTFHWRKRPKVRLSDLCYIRPVLCLATMQRRHAGQRNDDVHADMLQLVHFTSLHLQHLQ